MSVFCLLHIVGVPLRDFLSPPPVFLFEFSDTRVTTPFFSLVLSTSSLIRMTKIPAVMVFWSEGTLGIEVTGFFSLLSLFSHLELSFIRLEPWVIQGIWVIGLRVRSVLVFFSLPMAVFPDCKDGKFE